MWRTVLLVGLVVLAAGLGWRWLQQRTLSGSSETSFTSVTPPSANSPATQKQPLQIVVSLPVYEQLVQQLAGDAAQVQSLVASGVSAEDYSLQPSDAVLLSTSDLAVVAGELPLERQIVQQLATAQPNSRLLNLTEELRRNAAVAAQLDPQDPHIWLSPSLLEWQIKAIAARLKQLAPAAAPQITTNQQQVLTQLAQQRTRLQQVLQPCRDKAFMVVHPGFGYFAREYDLEQLSVEPLGGEAGPRDLTDAIAAARRLGLVTIFTQPQEGQQLAAQVAAATASDVQTLDDLAPDVIENYLVMAKLIADSIARCSR